MPKGIYKHKGHPMSEEHKRKLSLIFKGRKVSQEQKEQIRQKVKKLWENPEYRNNMVVKHRGKKMHPNTLKSLILANKGRKHSAEEIEARASRSMGLKRTEEQKKKNGDAHRGEKAGNWKGGITLGENRKKYYNFKSLERHTRKMKAEGSHTFGEWELLKKQYNYTCPCCKRKEPEIKLTQDHIIPLSKGGSDNIENIQPLCFSCNSKKNTKEIRYAI